MLAAGAETQRGTPCHTSCARGPPSAAPRTARSRWRRPSSSSRPSPRRSRGARPRRTRDRPRGVPGGAYSGESDQRFRSFRSPLRERRRSGRDEGQERPLRLTSFPRGVRGSVPRRGRIPQRAGGPASVSMGSMWHVPPDHTAESIIKPEQAVSLPTPARAASGGGPRWFMPGRPGPAGPAAAPRRGSRHG